MGTDICSGEEHIAFDMMAYIRQPEIPFTQYATNHEVRSRIERWIGETGNLLTIVRSRKLQWFIHFNRHTLAKIYPAEK